MLATRIRVPYSDLYAALHRATFHLGLVDGPSDSEARAALCARLFAEATRDGVYTHGLARFPRFAAMVANGSIDLNAQPTRVSGASALERWDGGLTHSPFVFESMKTPCPIHRVSVSCDEWNSHLSPHRA
jgi:hypothetical protein